MFIESERLELRTPEEEDIEFLQEGVNHPKVRRYISMFRTPYNREQYRDDLWTKSGDDPTLLIVPTEGEFDGEPIGSVSLSPIIEGDGYANFGIWLQPKGWGNGYATEASAHIIEYGFRDLRLHRISATIFASNESAKTLCKRLGFVHEGTIRETYYANGEYVDAERWGLLADEWEGVEEVLGK